MTLKTIIFKEVFAKEIYLCLREYDVENNYIIIIKIFLPFILSKLKNNSLNNYKKFI